MAELIEDVLKLIFDKLKTPIEWVQVSEVCQLWKSVATKHWREISTITYVSKTSNKRVSIKNIPEITAEDSERIFKCVAPFVQMVNTSFRKSDEYKDQHIQFGPFTYKVIDFNPEKVLKLLAEHAEKLTEVKFYEAPKPELLQRLINGKKIKTFKFERCNNFYEDVSTNDIEILSLQFVEPSDIIRPFKKHFLNLKELYLELKIDYQWSGLEPKLSSILPYVLGLTTINIWFYPSVYLSSNYSVSCETLMGFTKLLQLEELTLIFYQVDFTDFDFFIEHLVKSCLKLRFVCFKGMQFTDNHICTLLSLPHLYDLHLDKVLSFRSTELSKMSNLTKLSMVYDWDKFDITNFCKALRKMPKLELLEMRASGSEQSELNLVCEVILVAVSQNKNVIVSKQSGSWDLKIERKNAESLDAATLKLKLHITAETFSNDIKTFVKNEVESYIVVEKLKKTVIAINRNFFSLL